MPFEGLIQSLLAKRNAQAPYPPPYSPETQKTPKTHPYSDHIPTFVSPG